MGGSQKNKQQFSLPATRNAISERFVAQFHSSYIFIAAHATLSAISHQGSTFENETEKYRFTFMTDYSNCRVSHPFAEA
jgi:hypothetical protein